MGKKLYKKFVYIIRFLVLQYQIYLIMSMSRFTEGNP